MARVVNVGTFRTQVGHKIDWLKSKCPVYHSAPLNVIPNPGILGQITLNNVTLDVLNGAIYNCNVLVSADADIIVELQMWRDMPGTQFTFSSSGGRDPDIPAHGYEQGSLSRASQQNYSEKINKAINHQETPFVLILEEPCLFK